MSETSAQPATGRAVAVEVVELPPRTKILTFACEVPCDMSFVPLDPDSMRRPLPPMVNSGMAQTQQHEKGVIGTIAFLGDKSIMIWFGWGNLLQSSSTADDVANNCPAEAASSKQHNEFNESKARSVGAATKLTMGPLVVGMPRNKYKGAFSDVGASPLSMLVGNGTDAGAGIQNTRIASQVADRLSQRLDLAVFCSCNLEGPDTPVIPGCDGALEHQMLRSRAGALAEREIGRILSRETAAAAAVNGEG